MFKDSWATKIEVNENYVYLEADIHLISRAIALSSDLLNKLISPIDFNQLIKLYNKANERKILIWKNFTRYYLDSKIHLWLSTIDRKMSNQILTQIERFWNDIE